MRPGQFEAGTAKLASASTQTYFLLVIDREEVLGPYSLSLLGLPSLRSLWHAACSAVATRASRLGSESCELW
jgi:hypothetical protein